MVLVELLDAVIIGVATDVNVVNATNTVCCERGEFSPSLFLVDDVENVVNAVANAML